DHPWTKASRDHAAVRIAMTVVEAGSRDGALREVVAEHGLDTDAPVVELRETVGRINADLTVGADVTKTAVMLANEGLCCPGVKLHGAGFIVTPLQAKALGLGRRAGLDAHIRPYRNGRDLTGRPRGVMAIDLFGLTAAQARARFPEAYQHLMTTVKVGRETQYARSPTKDAAGYRAQWWVFGKPRPELRRAIEGLSRYIVTVETAKHRVFQFLETQILPDNMLVAIASDDAFHLGVLSSRIHGAWALRAGGWLGVGNDPRYSKSRCFDPFPFPDASQRERAEIRAVAEELDEHRKRVLSEHSELTLTQLYNVLEKLRAGLRATDLPPPDRHVYEDGLVAILGELHERIDRMVAGAYGWPADLSDEAMIARLVALNQERAAEEARGDIRFLRAAYQAGRSDRPDRQRGLEAGRQIEAGLSASFATSKPAFPKDEVAQTATIMLALLEGGAPVDASGLAARFREGRRAERRIAATLDALARLGAVATTRDAGGFSLRRP
ncbi:MAG TPA: type IIL restriction-modification enzyme MmeI, partial [Hansschlegelia sp.]